MSGAAVSGPIPWREVRRALDGPRIAADVGLRPARERDKYGCVACDSSDALHVYRNGAKCYSCGWSGSAIDLAAAAWRIEPREACRRLAEQYGVQPDPMYRRTSPAPRSRPSRAGADALRHRAEVYGELVARTTLGTDGRAYLAARGIAPALADAHGIRSAESPAAWRTTWAELERAHGADAMASAGLWRDGRAWYPWGGRVPAIALPYLSRDGQVEAVRWRRIDDAAERRYMAPLGAGARIPYRAEAVDGPRPLRLVVAEGELDALALVQAGYDAVGLGGATPSADVLAWLADALEDAEAVALWTDSDDAGDGAVDRLAAALAERYGAGWVREHVTRWRATADPADTLREVAA
jgi:hypothetical protein